MQCSKATGQSIMAYTKCYVISNYNIDKPILEKDLQSEMWSNQNMDWKTLALQRTLFSHLHHIYSSPMSSKVLSLFIYSVIWGPHDFKLCTYCNDKKAFES